MVEKSNINEWAMADRPRERFMTGGAETLSNAELLAILVGSGTQGENAVSLMNRLLADCNNSLSSLGKMTLRQLCEYRGIGQAKAITILAACELGRRRAIVSQDERPKISSSTDIYNLMRPRIQDLDVEEAWTLLLNNQMRLLRTVRLSHGGLTETCVDVRLLLREALLCNATCIVLCHNHPSNLARPSTADDDLTRRIQQAACTMRIRFIDHVILTDSGFYSYADSGKL